MKRFALILLLLAAPVAFADGPVSKSGKPVQCDLPVELRMKNTGGSDGAGLCVYSATTMSAFYQGESRLFGLRKYAESRPGGSWPDKLAKDIETVAPGCPVIQVQGADLAFIKLALQHGYLPAVTVMRGSHMLNITYADDSEVCLLDNNRPFSVKDGKRVDDGLYWKSTKAFLADARAGYAGGGIWVVVVLGKGPPPPIPANAQGTACGGDDDDDPYAAQPWTAPHYEWRHFKEWPGELHLYRDGVQVGAWTKRYDRRGAYYPRLGQGKWLSAAKPPIPVPTLTRQPAGDVIVASYTDYGCRYTEVAPGSRYTLCGKTITRSEAEGLLRYYATSRRLTVVGGETFRKTVLADLAGDAFKLLTRDVVIQDYDPENPLAKGVGYQPGITITAAPGKDGRGKVLSRAPRYLGPDALARQLRRTDPNYDPAKDPDLGTPPAPKPAPPPPAPNVQPPQPGAPVDSTASLVSAAVLLTLGGLSVVLKRMAGE